MTTSMLFWKSLLLICLLGIIGLSACSFTGTATPTSESQIIFTAAAMTVEAELTLIAAGAQATPTQVSPIVDGTNIPAITSTPTQGPPPSESTSSAICDRGGFVRDVSIPDGTLFEPGESFVKTWRLENTGTCTWNDSYSVIFDTGDAMGGPASFQLTSSDVAPGDEIDVSVDLKAPDDSGTFRGDWKLRNASGEIFGLGSSGNASFWVEIQVGIAPDFAIFFDNIHNCSGTQHAIFSVFNDGEDALESAEITLVELGSGDTIFGPLANSGPFMARSSECPQGADAVEPGKTMFLGASLGENPVSGQEIRATFEICNEDDMDGACTEKSIEFTIP